MARADLPIPPIPSIARTTADPGLAGSSTASSSQSTSGRRPVNSWTWRGSSRGVAWAGGPWLGATATFGSRASSGWSAAPAGGPRRGRWSPSVTHTGWYPAVGRCRRRRAAPPRRGPARTPAARRPSPARRQGWPPHLGAQQPCDVVDGLAGVAVGISASPACTTSRTRSRRAAGASWLSAASCSSTGTSGCSSRVVGTSAATRSSTRRRCRPGGPVPGRRGPARGPGRAGGAGGPAPGRGWDPSTPRV